MLGVSIGFKVFACRTFIHAKAPFVEILRVFGAAPAFEGICPLKSGGDLADSTERKKPPARDVGGKGRFE
jgi:hypothetical protein